MIIASGDKATIALGRVAQSGRLALDITERLANFAAARTEIEGRQEIVRGLSRQWYEDTSDLAKAIQSRLADSHSDANRRTLEIEVACSTIVKLGASERKHVLQQILAAWQKEVEPTQRIALARLIGLAYLHESEPRTATIKLPHAS